MANFTRNGTLLAQVAPPQVTAPLSPFLFPQLRDYSSLFPGLRSAPIVVQVYNQTEGNKQLEPSGQTPISLSTIHGQRLELTPSSAIPSIWPHRQRGSQSPAAAFPDLGFGLPVANFTRNGTLLAQVRASSGNSTTLTVTFPTTQGLFGTLPVAECQSHRRAGLQSNWGNKQLEPSRHHG